MARVLGIAVENIRIPNYNFNLKAHEWALSE